MRQAIKLSLLAPFLCLGLATPAAGASLLRGPLPMAPEERAELRESVEKARGLDPKPFLAMAQVREAIPRADARKRGRIAAVSPALRSMGREALLPALEMLAFGDSRVAELTESQRRALAVGLLEAVGRLRDPRALPVLRAALGSEETDFSILRAVAEAMGRVGDDESAKALAALARRDGPKRKPVLAGMGDCRRVACVEALAAALEAHPEPEIASLVVRSLGAAGSSWAWQTPGMREDEEKAVREASAKALLAAFVRYRGEVRQAASNELMVVDWSGTPALIAHAKADADDSTRAALEELGKRFAANPAR
ncbi:MAG: HEAT repeat domain-containing protein [Myxococcales bacterium]|jgi:hypothetical protein